MKGEMNVMREKECYSSKIRFVLLFVLAALLFMYPLHRVSADTEKEDISSNEVKSLTVKYIGEGKDIGDEVKKAELKVTGKLKSGKVITINSSNYELSDNDIDKPSSKITVSYKNSKGKTIKGSTTVKATKLVQSIVVEYVGGEKDAGDALKTSDFEVKGKNLGGNTVDIKNFSIDKTATSKEKNTTTVNVTYKNSLSKVLKKSVTVKSNKIIQSIKVTFNNEIKLDAGDEIKKSYFTVEGTTYGKNKVTISDADIKLSASTTSKDNQQTMVTVSYQNTIGKEFAKSIKITSKNAVKSIKLYYKPASTKYVGDSVENSEFSIIGSTYGGDLVDVTNFALENIKLESKKNTITANYTNTFNKPLTAKTNVEALNFYKEITVVAKTHDYYIGEAISTSLFTVKGVSALGTSENIKGFTMDKTIVDAENCVITFSYINQKNESLSCQVSITAKNNVTAAQVKVKDGHTFTIGDKITAEDLDVAVTNSDGSVSMTTDFTISSNTSLTKPQNNLTVKIKNAAGATITANCVVEARDYVTKIVAEQNKNKSIKNGNTLTLKNINDYCKVTATFKSGEKKELSKTDPNLTIYAGGFNLTSGGSCTLTAGSKAGYIEFKYKDDKSDCNCSLNLTYTTIYVTKMSITWKKYSASKGSDSIGYSKITSNKVSYPLFTFVDSCTISKLAKNCINKVTVTFNNGSTKELKYGTDFTFTGTDLKSKYSSKNAKSTITFKTLPQVNDDLVTKEGAVFTKDIDIYSGFPTIKSFKVSSYSGSTTKGTTPALKNFKFTLTTSTGASYNGATKDIAMFKDCITMTSAKKLAAANKTYTQSFKIKLGNGNSATTTYNIKCIK